MSRRRDRPRADRDRNRAEHAAETSWPFPWIGDAAAIERPSPPQDGSANPAERQEEDES